MTFKRFFALTLLLVAFLAASPPGYAQGPGDFVLGETSVMVPANGTATLAFETFCLDFGKAFPTTLGTPDGRADESVLQVVREAIENDMAEDEPLALQLAVWSLREDTPATELYPDDELPVEETAAKLLTDSEDGSLSALRTDRGISLDEAVADGSIQATSSDFSFVETDTVRPDEEPYHGRGTLTLKNTTDKPIEVYFPFGTVFKAANEDEQDIVAYAVELEQLATATVAPTNTPA
nr:hypothetical protein [Ardenticatenales bacterium]